MFVVANRFRIAEGYEEDFVDRFRNRQGAIDEQPGFVDFKLLVPGDDDTDTYVALTTWESRDAFDAWTESDAFESAHSGNAPREMFEEHPNLEVHEVAFEIGSD